MTQYRWLVVFGLLAFVSLWGLGCAEDNEDGPTGPGDAEIERIKQIFPTSLHATRAGKATYYEAADGFRSLTGISIEELACNKCHAVNYADGTPVDNATYEPGCKDCHADPDDPGATPVTDQICLGCHSRQNVEQTLFQDVHRAAGMECMDCHSADQMHGTGTAYPSMLAAGAPRVQCSSCHTAQTQGNPAHSIHLAKVDCTACHVKSVSSCYNCHFETEIAQQGKKRYFAQTPRTGFKMLMNYEGKVHTATFQALTHEGDSFVAIAPFYGHSITKEGIACNDCHVDDNEGNPNLLEYKTSGTITVTAWNAGATGAERLVGPTGVIPVPPDWKTALKFAFLQYTGNPTDAINGANNLPLWDYLEGDADGSHIVYGSPLTTDQMESLDRTD